jgi:tight adherence protein B
MSGEPLIDALILATVLIAGAGVHRGPTARTIAPMVTPGSAVGRMRAVIGRLWMRFGSRPRIRPGEVASWCDDLARRVRSGTSLSQALVESVPGDDAVRDATTGIRLAIERGRPVVDAVSSDGAGDSPRADDRHLATACSVIAVSATLGGASAAPLDRVAAALRLRAVDEQERASHSAQARLSAHVMTVIPIAMLCLMTTTDPDVRAVITEPIGVACVGAGLALNATGWWWMRHTIGRRP